MDMDRLIINLIFLSNWILSYWTFVLIIGWTESSQCRGYIDAMFCVKVIV